MPKKIITAVFTVALSSIFILGCETTTGFVGSTATGIGGVAYSTGKGAVKDTKDTANFIMKVDSWIKRNLW